MGGENSKYESVLRYFIFQKKIQSYLTNEKINRVDKNKSKEGYIINPDWIKEWKKAINYEIISKDLEAFKINSYQKIDENQKILIESFIEREYYQSFTNFNMTTSLLIKNNDFLYISKKVLSNDYWEAFLSEKAYDTLKINPKNTIEHIKYIFKAKMAIFFCKQNLLMKMIIKDNKPINLTFVFYYEGVYKSIKEYFKNSNSTEIIDYLKKRNIFSQKKYESFNKNNVLLYIIINEEYNKKESTIIKNPDNIDFSLIKRISFRGLDNVGATCYMNATLQCLANIKPVTDYFLDKKNYINLYNENALCKLTLNYIQVLIGLFCDKSVNGSYSPGNFKIIISELNPLFQGVQANDSKDLIIFLLEEINKELVEIHNKKNNIIQNNNEPFEAIDISNEAKVLNIFLKEYHKKHCSIIGAQLCGFNKSVFICQICQFRAINFNVFNFLIFSLEATSNYFNLSYNNTRLPIITFGHCFSFLSKEELFQDTYCQNCKQTCTSKYKETIYSMPNYLIIVLNRGKGNIFNSQVQIPEMFDSLKYVEKKK